MIAALLDFLFSFSAFYLLYHLVVDRLDGTTALIRERMLAVALLIAFIQLPIAWVVSSQRPETMPSALYLAVALYCLVHIRRSRLWLLILLAATVLQAFVRSDVPFIFGTALVLASFARGAMEELGTRTSNLLKGASIALIALGIQIYLQFILHPHLHYWPGTDVIQFKNNLQSFHNLSDGVMALFPFALLAIFLIVKRIHLDAGDIVALTASALYLPLWFTVGVIAEVRIYVPFMLILCAVAAKSAAVFLSPESLSGSGKMAADMLH